MEKKDFYPAICPRCGKSNNQMDMICLKCQAELLLAYNHLISWKTAYLIEVEQRAGQNIILDF